MSLRFAAVALLLARAAEALSAGPLPAGTAPLSAVAPRSMSAVVDEALEAVRGTDRGVLVDDSKRGRIDALIRELEASYDGCDALIDARLFRECEVVYVGQGTSKTANAAGGRFRGRVGRALFRTRALYQHVLREGGEDVAVNLVAFRLFGVLPGVAVLRGSVRTEDDREALSLKYSRALGPNTIRADFEAPRVSLGPRSWRLLNLRVGPVSTVRLDTTYLDDRVRISRGGSSGTPFIFTASGRTADADEWRAVYKSKPATAKGLAKGGFAAAVLAAVVRRPSVSAVLAVVSLGLYTSTGGIVENDGTQPMAS